MATYYPNSSPQIDVLSTPYGNMMIYPNPPCSTGSFSEISLTSSMNPENGIEIPSMGGRNEMMFIPPTSNPMCIQAISGPLNTGTSETVGNLQGLSLSLSTEMSTYRYSNPGLSSVLSTHLPLSAENSGRPMVCKVDEASPSKDMRNADYFAYDMHEDGNNGIRFGAPINLQYSINQKPVNCNLYQHEEAGIGSAILKSKYIKAAQQLLDEVVNLRDALKRPESRKDHKMDESFKESSGGSKPASEVNELSGNSNELSPAERQDLQNKLDRLHSMLDEVDRRYKQYYHQMQTLVSSFDVIAGVGAAKPYTALALKTISCHFRNLRDGISGQIQVTRKTLGEQDNGIGGAIRRLRYVDQQLRQQRALQQFGMMRHAWRPQRGLPESAVTILRAWLFEHFLHPYPKDSEKTMLARQTGLTRSQVANWFINARVRLWKPMVEEMYKEEFGDADINSRYSPENTAREKSWGSEDKNRDEIQESSTSMAHEIDGHDSKTYSFGNNDNHGYYTNQGEHLMVTTTPYQLPELGNFSVNNNNNNHHQVSLALGLRHREGNDVTFRGNGTTENTMEVATSDYPYLEQVNQQHRFGNNHPHILNNFVA